MDLFGPDPKRLHEKHDVVGLVRALRYGGTTRKAAAIRWSAAEYLAGYPHLAVLEALLEVGLSDSDARAVALKSTARLLYPDYQKSAELRRWWNGDAATAAEASQILARGRKSRREEEWREAKRRIDDRIGTPLHIEGIMRGAIAGDEPSPGERAEVKAWREHAAAQSTPLYEKARAELEAAWATQDAAWAVEETALAKWAEVRSR